MPGQSVTGRNNRPERRELVDGPLRVLVATADVLFARRFVSELSNDGRLELVGLASSANEAAAMDSQFEPTVLVLDEDLAADEAADVVAHGLREREGRVVVVVTANACAISESSDEIGAYLPRARGPEALAASLFETASLALGLSRKPLIP